MATNDLDRNAPWKGNEGGIKLYRFICFSAHPACTTAGDAALQIRKADTKALKKCWALFHQTGVSSAPPKSDCQEVLRGILKIKDKKRKTLQGYPDTPGRTRQLIGMKAAFDPEDDSATFAGPYSLFVATGKPGLLTTHDEEEKVAAVERAKEREQRKLNALKPEKPKKERKLKGEKKPKAPRAPKANPYDGATIRLIPDENPCRAGSKRAAAIEIIRAAGKDGISYGDYIAAGGDNFNLKDSDMRGYLDVRWGKDTAKVAKARAKEREKEFNKK